MERNAQGLAVQFTAYYAGGETGSLNNFTFSVQYAYGASDAVKRQAILDHAMMTYTTITGLSDFTGMRAEILGANYLKPNYRPDLSGAVTEAVSTLREYAGYLDDENLSLSVTQIRHGVAYASLRLADLIEYLVAQDTIDV